MDNNTGPNSFFVSEFGIKTLNSFLEAGFFVETCHINEHTEVLEVIFRDGYENTYRLEVRGIEPET